jgi:hypothetical protein
MHFINIDIFCSSWLEYCYTLLINHNSKYIFSTDVFTIKLQSHIIYNYAIE